MRLFTLLMLIIFFSSLVEGQGEWIRLKDSEVTSRHHPVTFAVGGNAYLLTGTTAQSNPLGTDNFYRYNPEEDSWTELERFPGGARSYAYAGVYNDKAYFGFGSNDFTFYYNDLWEFDPRTEQWTQLSSCSCIGRTHPAFVVLDGKIYVGLGGNNGDLKDWAVYDIETNAWAAMPEFPGPPRHHPYHFSAGGKVYAGFGHQGSNYFADWYEFDPNTQGWTQLNNHPAGPRVAGQEFSHNGYGYIISGDGNNHFNLQEGEFWKYLHENDTWERLPNHPGEGPDGRSGRWAPGSMVFNDEVYFFGGVSRAGGFLYQEVHKFPLEPTATSLVQRPIPSSLFLHPNPVTHTLTFEWENENTHPKIQVTILNTQGQPLISQQQSDSWINVESLAPGLYFLQVNTPNNKVYLSKFLKQ
jgi:N-acetylneuraminic acid mutarotase